MFILYYSSAQYLFFLTRNRVFELSRVFGVVTSCHARPNMCESGVSNMTGQPPWPHLGELGPAGRHWNQCTNGNHAVCSTSKIVCTGCRKIVNKFQYRHWRETGKEIRSNAEGLMWLMKKYIALPQNRTNEPTMLTDVSKTELPLHHSALLLLCL